MIKSFYVTISGWLVLSSGSPLQRIARCIVIGSKLRITARNQVRTLSKRLAKKDNFTRHCHIEIACDKNWFLLHGKDPLGSCISKHRFNRRKNSPSIAKVSCVDIDYDKGLKHAKKKRSSRISGIQISRKRALKSLQFGVVHNGNRFATFRCMNRIWQIVKNIFLNAKDVPGLCKDIEYILCAEIDPILQTFLTVDRCGVCARHSFP